MYKEKLWNRAGGGREGAEQRETSANPGRAEQARRAACAQRCGESEQVQVKVGGVRAGAGAGRECAAHAVATGGNWHGPGPGTTHMPHGARSVREQGNGPKGWGNVRSARSAFTRKSILAAIQAAPRRRDTVSEAEEAQGRQEAGKDSGDGNIDCEPSKGFDGTRDEEVPGRMIKTLAA
ncbi:hypothetical protein B0H12DRAFT_1074107 [Mycena haematopus]|nr:hypothetical protein B0H12DRAFT_1074107 [Mycena haematopus]